MLSEEEVRRVYSIFERIGAPAKLPNLILIYKDRRKAKLLQQEERSAPSRPLIVVLEALNDLAEEFIGWIRKFCRRPYPLED